MAEEDVISIRAGFHGRVYAQVQRAYTATAEPNFLYTYPFTHFGYVSTVRHPSPFSYPDEPVEMKPKLGCLGCGAAKWDYSGVCKYCGRQR